MNLLEYIARRETRNPDEDTYVIIGKVYDKKTGHYRAARDYEKDKDNKTKVEEFLCYKNGHIVVNDWYNPFQGSLVSSDFFKQIDDKNNRESKELSGNLKDYIEKSKFKKKILTTNKVTKLNLTPEEKEVVKLYTGGSDVCPSVNAYLRGHKEGTDDDIRNADILEGVFDKVATDSPALLFRKFQATDMGENMFVGDVFEDKGFASTSSNYNVASGFHSVVLHGQEIQDNPFVNVIITPEGSKALSIGDFSKFKNEKEVLLKNGTRFQILSKDDDNRIILSQVINDDKNILPSKLLKNSVGHRYTRATDHEKFLENMKDGERFAVLDLRGTEKPKNYFYTREPVLVDNPKYDKHNADYYKELSDKIEKLSKEIDDKFVFRKEKNPDYDEKASKRAKELDAQLVSLKKELNELSDKISANENTPAFYELMKKKSEKDKEYQEVYHLSSEIVFKYFGKLSEYNVKRNDYSTYCNNEEYQKLYNELRSLESVKYNYDANEKFKESLKEKIVKHVPKMVRYNTKDEDLELSPKFADDEDHVCILEVEKYGNGFNLKENMSGKVVHEQFLSASKDNIRKLMTYIDGSGTVKF